MFEENRGSSIGALPFEQTEDIVIMLFWDQSQEMKETCFSKPGEVIGETQIVIRKFALLKEDAEKLQKYIPKMIPK